MSRISVTLSGCDDLVELTCEVVHEFTPFTTAAVFIALTPANTPPSLPPSSQIIVKVFDPKVHFHRHKPPGVPWALAAETSAALARTAPFDPCFEESKLPNKGDLVGWEEYYYQTLHVNFRFESTAYARLATLQGEGIPRCFESGTWPPSNVSSVRRFSSWMDRLLALSLIKTVSKFGQLGVVHADLNPGNILFAPADRPSLAVIIDFGEACLREEDEDEDSWTKVVRQNRDEFYVGKRLTDKGLI
ncbi:hypothetical protein DFH06DRAFT_1488444 [Mycena polygramma]|nr:hypothetical protein DFH06DRAFT_1488444 [Mycena polygramma]